MTAPVEADIAKARELVESLSICHCEDIHAEDGCMPVTVISRALADARAESEARIAELEAALAAIVHAPDGSPHVSQDAIIMREIAREALKK